MGPNLEAQGDQKIGFRGPSCSGRPRWPQEPPRSFQDCPKPDFLLILRQICTIFSLFCRTSNNGFFDVDDFDDAGLHNEIDDDDDDADAFLEVLVLFLSRMCHKDYKVSLVS